MEHKKLIGDKLKEVYKDEYAEDLFTIEELLEASKNIKEEKDRRPNQRESIACLFKKI